MEIRHISEMTKGWFVGNFQPTGLTTTACEVAIKQYKAGDREAAHFHRIATEVTAVVSGSIQMCGKIFYEGDIIILSPGETTDFLALTDTTNVVVKIPGANNDKYIV